MKFFVRPLAQHGPARPLSQIMAQHFLLSDRAQTLLLREIYQSGEDAAYLGAAPERGSDRGVRIEHSVSHVGSETPDVRFWHLADI